MMFSRMAQPTNKFDGDKVFWAMFARSDIKSKIGLDKSRAMSIEKKIQIHSRKFKGNPIEKRLQSVNKSLSENPDLEFEIFHNDS